MVKRKRVAKQKRFGDEIIASLTEFKQALASGESLASRFNCRQVVLELEPHEFEPADVRSTRRLLRASQGVFAKFLGVSLQTVRAWEQGTKSPREVARRFMDEIRRDPSYWRARLQSAARPRESGRSS
jgi:putative transcriptional regulator